MNTTPVFVVGSGRCGTRLIYRLLQPAQGVTVYHEYQCELVQKLACLYCMDIYSRGEVIRELSPIYESAVSYCEDKYWVDSSNKTSWLIKPLCSMFPHAKFLWLMRDGRNVTSSFVNKLPMEVYDDEAVQTLWDWYQNRNSVVPPLEKRYWWNIYNEQTVKMSQFERICHHWVRSNRFIENMFKTIPDERKYFVKLEELLTSEDKKREVLAFFGQPLFPYHETIFSKPQNAIIPHNFGLTPQQLEQFTKMCSSTMEDFGYDINSQAGETQYVL